MQTAGRDLPRPKTLPIKHKARGEKRRDRNGNAEPKTKLKGAGTHHCRLLTPLRAARGLQHWGYRDMGSPDSLVCG